MKLIPCHPHDVLKSVFAAVLGSLLLLPSLHAQTAEVPNEEEDDELVELSPFTISAEETTGY